MIDNCRVVEEDSSGTTVEIDLFEHQKLLKDLTKKIFIKNWKPENSKRKLDMVISLEMHFLTIKIYNGF